MTLSVFEFEFELDPAGLYLISGAFLIGDAKTDEADGMGMVFHAVHQLFGKGKDVVLGTKDVIDGDAASDLLEVLELHFQRQGAAFEIVFLNATDEFEHGVIEMDGDIGILADVFLEVCSYTSFLTPCVLTPYVRARNPDLGDTVLCKNPFFIIYPRRQAVAGSLVVQAKSFCLV